FYKAGLIIISMHLLPTDFTLLISVRPCRGGMGFRQRHSRLILPRKNYRRSNRVPTVSAQLLFSRSIPFALENGPTNTNPLTALRWRGQIILSICRRTIQSLMANRYNAFGLLDYALTFANASQSQSLETRF